VPATFELAEQLAADIAGRAGEEDVHAAVILRTTVNATQ